MSIIEVSMLIFTNKNSNHFIHELDDSILEVSYGTSLKGWMDQALFSQYFMEPQAYQLDIYH